MSGLQVAIPQNLIEQFCRKWKITKLAVFGSALRDDFEADSDLDVLVTFAESASWSVFDHSRMSEELTALVGRPVDIIELGDLNNPFRRQQILESNSIVYAG